MLRTSPSPPKPGASVAQVIPFESDRLLVHAILPQWCRAGVTIDEAFAMTELSSDEALLQAGSLAFAILRFDEGAAHPSRGATPPDRPRLGDEAYMFAPSSRLVPRAEVPAFLAGLPSPAVLVSSTTRGVVALLLLDELSGERAAATRHNFANQVSAVDHLAERLGLTAESRILLKFEDEEVIVPLAVLRLSCERFAVHVGWNIDALAGDARAAAQLHLFRCDGVNTFSPDDNVVAITADVPIAFHADADMVLAALRRHVPTLLEIPPGETRVAVWVMLDENGRVEKTAVSTEPRPRGRRTMGQVLLEPFPGEKLRKFERAGTAMIPAGYIGPNGISVWWLQRRADVQPDPEHGVYQFDSLRLLPPRSTLEEVVKERYPTYARSGLLEMEDIPIRHGNVAFDPTPEECIVPWFIANDENTVVESWLGPYLQHPLIAREMMQRRYPNLSFTSVRIGEIGTEKGSRAPIVWATLGNP